MSSWTAASSDCSRPVNNYVHVKTADLYRPNARLTPERQGYQVLTPFGKLGYSPKIVLRSTLSDGSHLRLEGVADWDTRTFDGQIYEGELILVET